jgi:predicted Rossmann fold nucleotide-binding protein DprA/Smf involved in DNA uptake
LLTKTTKSKSSSKAEQARILSVSDYAKEFGLSEQVVRAQLKKGELKSAELDKNGRKVLAIEIVAKEEAKKAAVKPASKGPAQLVVKAEDIVSPEPATKPSTNKEPKLIKIGSLKTVNHQEIIQEKDDEIIKLKSELRSSYEQNDKFSKELKRLTQIIKSKSDLIQSQAKMIEAKDSELQSFRPVPEIVEESFSEVDSEKFTESKKAGFFAKLFGKK